MIRVERFTSVEDWADTIGTRLVGLLAAKPDARLCLATGNTPVPVYARLAAAVRHGRATLRDAEVFLLDEFGGVPTDAAGRCDMMLRRDLLRHVDLPDERYHRIDTEAPDLATLCRRYDAAVSRHGLDLTILGIGTNGHVGMNEPGAPPDSPTRRVDLAPETQAGAQRYFGGQHAPTWGITLGLGPLFASREIWLLATGSDKADVVRRLLTESPSTNLPASLLHQHANTVLFVDSAAAPLLAP